MSVNPSDGTLTGGLRLLVDPVLAAQSYRNLAFLLGRLPLGVAYFTTFFTGLVVGVVLTPLGVGIPFLGVIIGFSDYAGLLEAKATSWLLDADVTHVPVHDPHEEPLLPYVKSTLTEPGSYLLVAYFLLSLAVGVLTFTVIVTVFGVSVVLLLAPVASATPGTEYTVPDLARGGGTVAIDTLPEGLALSVVGLVALLVGVHVANAIATGHAKCTAAVLRTSRTDCAVRTALRRSQPA